MDQATRPVRRLSCDGESTDVRYCAAANSPVVTQLVTQDHHRVVETTPLWVPLVIAGLGVAGTLAAGIAGVLITQNRSDHRENRAWSRERLREQERWDREDETRTFEHRRDAYVEFYESLKAMALRAYDHGYGFTDDAELPFDWNTPTFRRLQRLSIYATSIVTEAASAAYDAAWAWGSGIPHDDPERPEFGRLQERYDAAEIHLLMLIREDLGIPGGDLDSVP